MGFETPVDPWLRQRHLRQVRERLLGWGPHLDWMERDALARELEGWSAGRRPIGLQVWRWLSLESWGRRYLASDPRVIERVPEIPIHAGSHMSYLEAAQRSIQDLEPIG
jgi:hypothetical protein